MKKTIKETRVNAIKRHFVRGLITGTIASLLVIYSSGNYPTSIETGIFSFVFASMIGAWNGILAALHKYYTLSH